jgi:hypothetical protein
MSINPHEPGPGTLPAPLRALHRLWASRLSGARLPKRADFPLQSLKPWIGHLALLEAAEGGYRFRLCGTELIPRFTREATGLTLDALAPEICGGLTAALQSARDSKGAVVASARIEFEARCTEYCDLVLPLYGGQDVTELLFGSYAVRQVRP